MIPTLRNAPAITRTAILVVFALILITGCSMPFEWAGAMPGSWEGGTDTGTSEDGETDGNEDGDTGTTEDGPAGDPVANIQRVTVSGSSFTLAWDADDTTAESYRLYSRPYGASSWQLLADDVSQPQYTVTGADLDYGDYEFAVSSVSSDGTESGLHHSFDDSADPQPWYLVWVAA